MKTLLQTIFMLATVFSLSSCDSQRKVAGNAGGTNDSGTAHTSENSLDWAGIYTGILPCASCPGILTIVKLEKDLSYVVQTEYLGEQPDTVYQSGGTFTWDDQGNKITLSDTAHTISPRMFQVGENMLTSLDLEGNKVTSELADHYILMKIYPGIAEKYWKLKELYGKQIQPGKTLRKEPHIILKVERNRITGSSGCNSFTGSYEIKKGNRITFSRIVSTRMACPDMETETQLFKILNSADHYILHGDTLVLSGAGTESLARFEAVHME
jgi:heat shock protein HslJ